MVITAVMVRKQQAIVRAFEQASATTAATTRTAEQLGLKPGGLVPAGKPCRVALSG